MISKADSSSKQRETFFLPETKLGYRKNKAIFSENRHSGITSSQVYTGGKRELDNGKMRREERKERLYAKIEYRKHGHKKGWKCEA